MPSAPARTARFATLVALLIPVAACSSAHHSLSTSAGAPRRSPSVMPGAGVTSGAPPTVVPATVGATGTAGGPGSGGQGAGAGGAFGARGAAGVGAPGVGAAGVGGSAAAAGPARRGTVTVAEYNPVLAHGTATAPVTCETSGAVYVALVSKAQAGGFAHSFTVRVTGYRGPGQYRGTLSATVTGPHGTVAALTRVAGTAVTVTRSGGTFSVNVTGSGNHSLDATVRWSCP